MKTGHLVALLLLGLTACMTAILFFAFSHRGAAGGVDSDEYLPFCGTPEAKGSQCRTPLHAAAPRVPGKSP